MNSTNYFSRVTINAKLKVQINDPGLSYNAGDHVGIMADNRDELVEGILKRLVNKPGRDDEPIQLELLEEKHTPMGTLDNLRNYLIYHITPLVHFF